MWLMRRWSRSLVVFLAMTAGVAGLAGCGGSSSSGSSKAAFCSDNLKLDKASSNASSASDVIKVFKDNQSTIDDFAKNAPSDIKAKAQTLASAADQAIKSGDASSFGTQAVADAGKAVDSFCGVSSSST
jgi:hypothetical protein